MRSKMAKVLWALVLLMSVAEAAAASRLAAFNRAVAEAYEPYRGAVSYLRTGNLDLAALEIEAASERWKAVVSRFAETPPDAFADDAEWGATLGNIGTRLKAALQAVDQGDKDAALTAAGPIRRLLGDLRRRNHVIVFSDRVDEITASMDRLWAFRKSPPDFASPEDLRRLRHDTAVLGYLVERCREEAPAELLAREDFRRLLDGTQEAVDRMWRAIEGEDGRLLINTLRELRSYDRMLFLRFG